MRVGLARQPVTGSQMKKLGSVTARRVKRTFKWWECGFIYFTKKEVCQMY